MAHGICPQRILKQAIKLLEESQKAPGADNNDYDDDVIYNVLDLRALEKALHSAGITCITAE